MRQTVLVLATLALVYAARAAPWTFWQDSAVRRAFSLTSGEFPGQRVQIDSVPTSTLTVALSDGTEHTIVRSLSAVYAIATDTLDLTKVMALDASCSLCGALQVPNPPGILSACNGSVSLLKCASSGSSFTCSVVATSQSGWIGRSAGCRFVPGLGSWAVGTPRGLLWLAQDLSTELWDANITDPVTVLSYDLAPGARPAFDFLVRGWEGPHCGGSPARPALRRLPQRRRCS